jgi:hypothetical protein
MQFAVPEGFHIEQINVATAQYDMDDPRMADFVSALGIINAIAERSEGFVWRFKAEDAGMRDDVQVGDNPRTIVQMSIWTDAANLERFVWKTAHAKAFGRRQDWFVPEPGPNLAFWCQSASSVPDLHEGYERYLALRSNGPSQFAFG